MERFEILATMAELRLCGMKAAYDEIIGTSLKRQHDPHRIVGDLLTAETSIAGAVHALPDQHR